MGVVEIQVGGGATSDRLYVNGTYVGTGWFVQSIGRLWLSVVLPFAYFVR